MNSNHSAEIRNKEYRHGLIAAQIDIDLPLQLRALRKERGLTQPELAQLAGMKQPRFPVMERPGGAKFNLETLRRLAEALDVALIVRFAPFSELLDWTDNFNPQNFSVPSFEEEFEECEEAPEFHQNETSAWQMAEQIHGTTSQGAKSEPTPRCALAADLIERPKSDNDPLGRLGAIPKKPFGQAEPDQRMRMAAQG